MRLTDKEQRDFSTPPVPKAPKYPHGLRVRLGPEEIEKLSFMKEPDVGSKLHMVAVVEVVEVSKVNATDEQDEGFSVELQIVDMELKPEKEEKKSSTQVIYGS